MKTLIALAALALSTCGKEAPVVRVECFASDDAFLCTANQSAGTEPVNTCWTIKLVCENGAESEARQCLDTAPGGTASTVVREESFAGIDACDSAKTVSVVSIAISRQAP